MTGTLVGVSLKAYFGHERALRWLEGVAELARHPAVGDRGVQLFVIPAFTELAEAARILAGTGVLLGAQDVFWEDAGPYTGEVTADVLAELGVQVVEVGHAERRQLFGETDEVVAAKCAAAVRHGITPLLCVGERRQGTAADAVDVVRGQLAAAAAPTAVVAWEPVWAIGAESPAGAGYIREVCAALRGDLGRRPLIYGGSAAPGLLTELGDCVDGLFLGRSAHDLGSLRDVLEEAAARGAGRP